MSPALFNNVTRRIFDKLKAKWARDGVGTVVGGSRGAKTTHCMFADDTTLFADSKHTLIQMLHDVMAELAKHGLNLNLDKCVVQTNVADVILEPIEIHGQNIPMVDASVGFRALGTQFTLLGRCGAEIKSRMSVAWAKFYSLCPVLGKRDGNLHKRLRLFDTTVAQTALWCCESWLLTQKEKRLVKATQHAMLRRIAGPRRNPDEDWIAWVQRSTRAALAHARASSVRIWLDFHHRSKYTWAGHVVRMDSNRLARRALTWRDSEWWASEFLEKPARERLRRPHCTHWFRYEDELKRFALAQGWQSWQGRAKVTGTWLLSTSAFCQHVRR